MAGETLEKIRKIRLEKIAKLKSLGINPYPSDSNKNITNKEIIDQYPIYEGKEVVVAGRLMSRREHGPLVFGHIEDESAKIQLYIKESDIENTSKEKQIIGFNDLELIDVGDFIEAKGIVTKTQRGEISILVKELRILTKSLRPLPDKWEGLKDKEEKFRRRYLDLVMNKELREMFVRKEKFWKCIREFLLQKGFHEFDTPVLEMVPGGADANPFVTHHDALDTDFYMRISSELYQKRLIGAGYEKVFVYGPNFRNEGISDEHLQEFMDLEWYYAYANYEDNMKLVEDLYKSVVKSVYGKSQFKIRGHSVDFDKEWDKIDFAKVIQDRHGVDIYKTDEKTMYEKIKAAGVKIEFDNNRNRLVDNLWKIIRKEIAGPAFLINHPKFISPLAKSHQDNENITERFQVIIAGSEIGNGYSEINDPVDQLERFLDQRKLRESGDTEAQMLDIDFVEMLEYGMPPTSGFGFSERLFWFLEDVTAREGVFFPQMRFEYEDATKSIYGDILEEKVKSQISNLQSISRQGKQAHDKDVENTLDENDKLDLSQIPESELVSISDEVKKKFEGIKIGYIVVENINVEKESPTLESLKQKIENIVKNRFPSTSDIKKSSKIEGFRKIYKEFGVDPNSKLNSAEALLRRVVSGKGLYNINTVVDTYNVTSIENELPMAAYDLDKIKGKIALRFAKDGDSIVKIGDEEPTNIGAGELVYSDDVGVTCLDYNYRDSDRTKVTEETKKIIIFVDGHVGNQKSEIENVLSIVAKRLIDITGGKIISKGYID